MGLAAVGDYFPIDRRAWAIGMVSIGQPLAWVTGLPLIGLLADLGGWRWSFVGVPFAFSLIGFWFVWQLPAVKAENAHTRRDQPNPIRAILTDRSAGGWVLSELFTYVGWAGTLTFLGTFYISRYHLTAGTASPLLALTAAGFAVGSFNAHRLRSLARPQTVILGGAVISSVFLAVGMGVAMPLVPTVVVMFLFGLGQGFRGATSSALGLRQAPRYRGAIMALRASVVQFGYVFGGVIGGVLLATSGLTAVGLGFAALIAIAGLLVQFLVYERPESDDGI
jgi:predicted MFS family arabinose efflux permease